MVFRISNYFPNNFYVFLCFGRFISFSIYVVSSTFAFPLSLALWLCIRSANPSQTDVAFYLTSDTCARSHMTHQQICFFLHYANQVKLISANFFYKSSLTFISQHTAETYMESTVSLKVISTVCS